TGGTPNTGGIIATNPLLGPLAYNGGPTPTMALLPGSPAAQAGDVAAAPGTDQQGNPRLTGGSLNLGAVQFQAGSAPAQFLAGGTVTGANLQFQFTGNTGAGYSVFASSNLFLPLTNWIYLGAATQISLGLFQFQVTSGTNVGQYYYRVSQP
ncbi:MAG TPA: choice-of-anchor Q domain-containing protein, partial [Verrucomicrobiae bacterium]